MTKQNQKNKRVVVAMSGGVDSSVAAVLLKKQGYNVIGVFMKFWKAPTDNGLVGGWNRCCSFEAESRARKVAKILGIPFYVFNFEKEFKKRVVDYFLKEYKAGRTPNPCVVCNKEIKFGLLLEKALKLGADYVATGHYARLRPSDPNLRMTSELSEYSEHSDANLEYSDRLLLKAKDKNKDQSYFLWRLNQGQLKRIIFPIGDYTREEVLVLAKKFKLSFLTKIKKSQEICFVQTTINDFLKKYLKSKPGKIICLTPDVKQIKQRILGRHQGLWFYTIGQRKGIGLPAEKPYYVLAKDFKKNILIVTQNEKDLYQKELSAKNVNWVSGKEPKLPARLTTKIRYRHKITPATLHYLKSNIYYLIFDKPQRAITPGQSVVFYIGQELLGGGTIDKEK